MGGWDGERQGVCCNGDEGANGGSIYEGLEWERRQREAVNMWYLLPDNITQNKTIPAHFEEGFESLVYYCRF